ncbi:MAG: hypothetical protein WDZ77_02700 [Candidatus Pacearchaeota archaeon]
MKIDPETVKKKVEDYVGKLRELKEVSYSKEKERMYSIDVNIKSFLNIAFENSKERNKDYQGITIGFGVREYYKNLGYELDSNKVYMVKKL